ncbi:MAG TPA: hypothetical protein VLG37_05275 [Candidatus Saccharimonadales bacterium]|nr:hypothetical protein [Candidatus Saccharimonadales bacterium]
MKKLSTNSKGFGVIELLIIVVIVGIVGGVGYFVYHKNSTKNVTSTSVKTGSKKTDNANVSVTAPVTQTENCGDQGCFEKKFAECKPATLTAGFGEDIKTASVVVYYKINGPEGDGCNMVFRYTKNPNPDWENKDLTCNWDNKKAFQDSIEQTFNNLDGYACEGPLLPLLKG